MVLGLATASRLQSSDPISQKKLLRTELQVLCTDSGSSQNCVVLLEKRVQPESRPRGLPQPSHAPEDLRKGLLGCKSLMLYLFTPELHIGTNDKALLARAGQLQALSQSLRSQSLTLGARRADFLPLRVCKRLTEPRLCGWP